LGIYKQEIDMPFMKKALITAAFFGAETLQPAEIANLSFTVSVGEVTR